MKMFVIFEWTLPGEAYISVLLTHIRRNQLTAPCN
jgi:hypothetical protein